MHMTGYHTTQYLKALQSTLALCLLWFLTIEIIIDPEASNNITKPRDNYW